jgi:uncharacterized protein (TIGR03067 family)
MRHAIGLTFMAALVLPVWADDKPAVDEKLVGTWTLIKTGLPGSPEVVPLRDTSVTLDADGKATFRVKGKADSVKTWRVDAGRSPREITLVSVYADGQTSQPNTFIYRLDGDMLELARPAGGNDSSKSFDPKEAVVMTYKRQKP